MYDDDCYTPDLLDSCPIEYITESDYADNDADNDADLDGWDEDGWDEDEEG